MSCCLPKIGRAQADSNYRFQLDFPYFGEQKKLVQDVNYRSPLAQSGTLAFSCYLYRGEGDSIFVYGQKQVAVSLKAGVASLNIAFGPNDANSFVLSPFYDILHQCSLVPAGVYKTYLKVNLDSGGSFTQVYRLVADSNISANSSLSRQVNNSLLPKSNSTLGSTALRTISSAVPAAKTLEQSAARLSRSLKRRGLTSQTEQHGKQLYIHLWHQDWYVGRYTLDATTSVTAQLGQQQKQIGGNLASLANNELEGYQSLFSQLREMTKSSKEDKELQGELAMTGNFSNGQPEYSAQDNNFYELRGQATTEVADIPVSLEGYYTTQDRGRQVKASYIRVHYDAEAAKAKLMKLISGYRRQYEQTVSKGKGLEYVCSNYLASLQQSQDQLLYDIRKQAGLSANAAIQTDSLQAQISAALSNKLQDTSAAYQQLDSAGKLRKQQERAAKIQDSALLLYNKAMKQYEQAQQAAAQVEKYKGLFEQYQNTSYFDSALAYSKVQDLQNSEDLSYKQLAKSAAGFLPEGKVKSFVTGLTHLDAGIINKYSSKYTAAGQQLTGLDVGYDIGFAEIEAAVGKTEYAGRTGQLEKYTTYSASAGFKPAKGQKAKLVYYGYTPSKSMLQDDGFFKNADIALPSFRQPVHIVSASYEGQIAKAMQLEAEFATSFRNSSDDKLRQAFDADRTAWHLHAEGQLPRTTLSIRGSYEHGGRQFQNSTLPLNIAGTDLYKLGIKGDFFRSFLTAGLEYNYMQQQNLYSTGGNSRWGFEIATHSKQYPSVSLSYKPFTTFRAFNDTLNIPQRPLQGAVWTGKASYQIRKAPGVSYRFSAVLNRSTSKADSLRYGADLIQLNGIYTDKEWMLMLSLGQSMLQTQQAGARVDSLHAAHVRTNFAMGSVSRQLSKSLGLSGGGDIGFAPFGLSKWGLQVGLNYRLKQTPLTARISTRYGAYRLEAYSGTLGSDLNGSDSAPTMTWRPLLSGCIELIWQFKMKIND